MRAAFVGAAGGLLLLSLLGVVALLGSVWWLEGAGTDLSEASIGIQAAEEIQVALLAGDRARLRNESNPGQGHDVVAAEADRSLYRWLDVAAKHLRTDEEAEALRRLQEAVTVEMPGGQQGIGGTAAGAPVPALDKAIAAADQFIRLNQAQADDAIARWQRWQSVALGLAIGLSIFIPIVLILGIWFIRRTLYRPFLVVEQAISRYGAGASATRAPMIGPTELRSVAARFNDTAETLANQRTAQLSFLAAVAHDLRNPLTVLKTTAGLLERQTSPEKIRDKARLMDRQLGRLNRMVEDLLDTSRIEAGEFEIQLVQADLREQVREVVSLFENESDRHRFIVELPGEPVCATVDPMRISQVLTNLVSNALKYSPDGGDIDVSLEASGREAVIRVRDPGIGIAADDLPRILEPFRRGTLTAGDIPGVGLGLSVARRLVEAHGGYLEVESRKGEGSTFSVHLPLGH